MTEGQDFVSTVLQNPMGALRLEDLMMEALRDLVKDEIKRHIRVKLEEDPALRDRIRTAVTELMDAKVREAYAMIKLGKCGAELGIALVPEELRERMERDVARLLEREVAQVIGHIE